MTAQEVESLIDQFGTDVYRFCSSLCGNKADTEDLYQQTFLKIMEINNTIKWNDNPKGFLFSVTNSIWKNNIRKQARHSRIAPSSPIEEVHENVMASNTNIEQEFFTKLRNQKLNEIIQLLPEKIRAPIILYYTLELPVEEVSKIVNIPVGTVKSRLHKGRSIIKKGLEEHEYEYA